MADFAALRALAFGASLGLAVGPIALLIVNVGLTRGMRRAAACALGVAAADFSYALLALAVGAQLEGLLRNQRTVFELATATLLLGLGIRLAASAWARSAAPVAAMRKAELSIGMGGAYLLTLANPLTIVLFVSFSGQLPLAGEPAATLAYAVLIFLGSLPLQIAYAAVGAGLRTAMLPAWVHRANLVSALAITTFGGYGIWQAL